MPKISIIVPVYKVEKYIRRCLDSIQAQTFIDWECILIDDGSPDASGKICDEYASKDDRFKVFHQENAGVSAARNQGLDCAKGEWITFVDSDDWIDRGMLGDLHNYAINNEADVVISGFIQTNGQDKRKETKVKNGSLDIPKDFEWFFNAPWGKLFKKEIVDKHNIKFPLGITLAEDMYFVFFVLYYSKKIYGITNTYYNYFENANSVTKLLSEKNVQDEIWVIKQIEQKLIDENKGKEWFVWLDKKKIITKNHYIFHIKPIRCDLARLTFPSVNWLCVCQPNILKGIIYIAIFLHCDYIVKYIEKIKR